MTSVPYDGILWTLVLETSFIAWANWSWVRFCHCWFWFGRYLNQISAYPKGLTIIIFFLALSQSLHWANHSNLSRKMSGSSIDVHFLFDGLWYCWSFGTGCYHIQMLVLLLNIILHWLGVGWLAFVVLYRLRLLATNSRFGFNPSCKHTMSVCCRWSTDVTRLVVVFKRCCERFLFQIPMINPQIM